MNQYRLKKILRYYPVEGVFRWLRSSGGIRKGSIAGYKDNRGYVVIRYQGKNYYAHRLAWFYMCNTLPKFVDHWDLDKSNNKWFNLREATQAQNQYNSVARNKLGVKGVDKRGNRYQAKATYEGKFYHLGVYPTLELASKAFKEFTKPRHGEFFRYDV